MSRTAVVILNYNGRDFLLQFIPELIKHTLNAELIVADNASTDDSLKVLEAYKEIKILRLNQNYGYAGGYNEALNQIDADYFALVNSDIEVTKNWLPPLISFLEQNSDYAAVQPKIKDYKRKSHFEYAGAAGGFLDPLGYPYCRGRLFDSIEEDIGQYDQTKDVFWTSGACFVIRAEVFKRLGGFDASFFAHMEEIDLCWRLQSNGYNLSFIPQSEVYHVGGGTLNKVNAQKTYLNFRNGLWLLVKNLPKSELSYKLPIRIFLDLIAGLKFGISHSFSHFWAVLKAIVHGLASTPKYLRNHPRSSLGHSSQSILMAYFIKGKKKFSEL